MEKGSPHGGREPTRRKGAHAEEESPHGGREPTWRKGAHTEEGSPHGGREPARRKEAHMEEGSPHGEKGAHMEEGSPHISIILQAKKDEIQFDQTHQFYFKNYSYVRNRLSQPKTVKSVNRKISTSVLSRKPKTDVLIIDFTVLVSVFPER